MLAGSGRSSPTRRSPSTTIRGTLGSAGGVSDRHRQAPRGDRAHAWLTDCIGESSQRQLSGILAPARSTHPRSTPRAPTLIGRAVAGRELSIGGSRGSPACSTHAWAPNSGAVRTPSTTEEAMPRRESIRSSTSERVRHRVSPGMIRNTRSMTSPSRTPSSVASWEPVSVRSGSRLESRRRLGRIRASAAGGAPGCSRAMISPASWAFSGALKRRSGSATSPESLTASGPVARGHGA